MNDRQRKELIENGFVLQGNGAWECDTGCRYSWSGGSIVYEYLPKKSYFQEKKYPGVDFFSLSDLIRYHKDMTGRTSLLPEKQELVLGLTKMGFKKKGDSVFWLVLANEFATQTGTASLEVWLVIVIDDNGLSSAYLRNVVCPLDELESDMEFKILLKFGKTNTLQQIEDWVSVYGKGGK